ncbi:hypothetical protein [Sphingomonas sp. ID0503]|uniref:hypothetical protein n=1 Tax=Sphingomonas sp. ID0503 TaxID=3399691 RepID=UPI003AFA42F2
MGNRSDVRGQDYVFVRGGEGSSVIEVGGKPEKAGILRGVIQVDGESVAVRQIVWP